MVDKLSWYAFVFLRNVQIFSHQRASCRFSVRGAADISCFEAWRWQYSYYRSSACHYRDYPVFAWGKCNYSIELVVEPTRNWKDDMEAANSPNSAVQYMYLSSCANVITLEARQSSRHFADSIFKLIFSSMKFCCILKEISLKCVP